MSVRHPEDAASKPPPEVLDRIDRELAAFHEELRATGAWVFAGGLHPSTSAAVVRADGDDVVMTDGPYAETKEQLGSYFLIEARDLNEAIQVASKHPAARINEHLGWGVEVRPIEMCRVGVVADKVGR